MMHSYYSHMVNHLYLRTLWVTTKRLCNLLKVKLLNYYHIAKQNTFLHNQHEVYLLAPPIFLFLTETTNTVEKIVFEVEQRLARFLDCPLANVLVSYSSATCDNAQSYG